MGFNLAFKGLTTLGIVTMIDEGMNKGNWRNDDNIGKLQYFEKNLSHSHFV